MVWGLIGLAYTDHSCDDRLTRRSDRTRICVAFPTEGSPTLPQGPRTRRPTSPSRPDRYGPPDGSRPEGRGCLQGPHMALPPF